MANRPKKKNIILLVDAPTLPSLATLEAFPKEEKRKYRFMLIYSSKYDGKENKEVLKKFNITVSCNLNSPDAVISTLLPYKEELLAVYCRAEAGIPNFQKIIPFVPYLKTPTTESLDWSINKYKMRKRFYAYDKKVTPKFMLIKDKSKQTLKEVESKIGFPLVIKPAGLAQSILVNIVYHREELEKEIGNVFRKIKQAYKESSGRGEPQVIVEQFKEGDMYSIDGYINSRGKVYCCPMVWVKTGKQIGFDDFFGYQQMTPTSLTKASVENAEKVATIGVRALGLRSTAFHAELIKSDKGWTIIEIGPRIGGFRHDLYKLSYGINHRVNAVKIGIPEIPKIPKRIKGYSAALKVFAKTEGTITNLTGIKKIKELKSLISLSQNKKVGDKARFAKHGGKSVFNALLFNKDRSKLLADIRRMEQMIKIEIKPKGKK